MFTELAHLKLDVVEGTADLGTPIFQGGNHLFQARDAFLLDGRRVGEMLIPLRILLLKHLLPLGVVLGELSRMSFVSAFMAPWRQWILV
jgi:hypothetical protein